LLPASFLSPGIVLAVRAVEEELPNDFDKNRCLAGIDSRFNAV
jgi:hypothetical protein